MLLRTEQDVNGVKTERNFSPAQGKRLLKIAKLQDECSVYVDKLFAFQKENKFPSPEQLMKFWKDVPNPAYEIKEHTEILIKQGLSKWDCRAHWEKV